ncbi:MAG: HlyC/CorC family transporter, partial [Deltaproteobacteria bacterium]
LTTVLLLLLALSFLFSGMETGILSLNRMRLRQLIREGDRRARLLNRYLSDPESFLWTILVGNTLANIAAAWIILHAIHSRFPGDPVAFGLGALVVAMIFFLVGEILPKTLFGMFPTRLCLMLSRPFRLAHFLIRPMVVAVELLAGGILRSTGGKPFGSATFASREELRWLMQESGQTFTSEERIMINRVMDLEKLTVRSRLVPWSRVVSVDATTPMGEVMDLARQRRFTRMPVWEDKNGERKVAGLISLKRLLFEVDIDPSKPAGDYTRPALFLDESKRLEDALQLMQKTGHRMAVVQDRNKETVGIICLEDILKVIFGEVRL